MSATQLLKALGQVLARPDLGMGEQVFPLSPVAMVGM